MADDRPGLAPLPQSQPPGQELYQAFLAQGGQAKANAWKEWKTQQLMATGQFNPQKVDAYFGDTSPKGPNVAKVAETNLHQQPDLLDDIAKGWHASVLGTVADTQLPLRLLTGAFDNVVQMDQIAAGWKKNYDNRLNNLPALPDSSSPKDFQGSLAYSATQIIANSPFMVAGAILGTPGGPAGMGALAGGLPTALREGLLLDYNQGHLKTGQEAIHAIAGAAERTAEDAATSGIASFVGGEVGAKVLSITGSKLLGFGASTAGMLTGAEATHDMLRAQLPDANSFAQNAILTIALTGVGHVAGSIDAAELDPQGEVARRVQHNLQQVYAKTGIPPWTAYELARQNPTFRQELMAQDPYGDPVMPHYRMAAPEDIATSKKTALLTSASPRAFPVTSKSNIPSEQLADASDVIPALEGGISRSGKLLLSPKGAFGIHQIMPGAARQYGMRGTDEQIYEQLSNPQTDARMFATIMSDLKRRYPGDPLAQLVAYNAGPGRANEYIREGAGTRLEAIPDKNMRGGIRYETVSAERDESHLPLETQKYLANAQRFSNGKLPEVEERQSVDGPSWSKRIIELTKETTAQTTEQNDDRLAELSSASAQSTWDHATPEQLTAEILSNVGKQPADDPWSDFKRGGAFNPDQIVSNMFELNPVRNIDRARIAEGDYNRTVDMGLEDYARRTYAADAIAQVMARKGNVDALTGKLDPEAATLQKVWEQVKEDKGNYDDFIAYLLSQRTIDKQKQGIETGFNPYAATSILKHPEYEKYEKAADIWRAWTDNGLQFYRDSGMISGGKQYAMWAANPTFISMRRLMGNDGADIKYRGSNWGLFQGLHQMEGNDGKIIDPVLATLDNQRMQIALGLKNQFRQQLIGTVKADPELAAQFGLKKTNSWANPNQDEVDKELQRYGFTEEQLPAAREAFGSLVAMRQVKMLPDNEFVVWNDGKPETYSVADKNLARVLRGSTSRGSKNAVVKMAGAIAKIQRTGIAASPDFPAKIAAFHQINQYIMDPSHPAPYYTLMRGLMHVLKADDLFDEVQAHGGFGAALVDMDRDWLKEDMGKIFDKQGVWDKVQNYMGNQDSMAGAPNLVGMAQTLQRTFDESNRVGVYLHATKDLGIEPQKAAIIARKAGLDYAERAGDPWLNGLEENVAFLRPHLIGLKQGAEALENQGAGQSNAIASTLWHAGLAITVPTMMLYAANYFADKDQPEGSKWKDIPQWERDQYYITPPIGGMRLKLRLPANYGLVFGGLVNRTLDALVAHNPGKMESLFSSFLREYSPNPFPSWATAPFENAANWNFGTGTPLMSDAMMNRVPDLRYTDNTSQPAIALSHIIGEGARAVGMADGGISPIQIDHMVTGVTGSLGIDALRAVGAPWDHRPFDPANIPGVGSFFVRNPGMNSQVISDFYNDAKHYSQEGGTLSFEKRQAGVGIPPDLSDINLDEAAPGPQGVVARITKSLSLYRSVIEGVEQNKQMNGAEKRQAIDALTWRAVISAEYGEHIMGAISNKGLNDQQRREIEGLAADTYGAKSASAPPVPDIPGTQ